MDDVKIERLTVMVEEMHHAIMGNGKPGLLTEWQCHKEEHAEMRGSMSVWKWVVGGLSSSGLLAGAASWFLNRHQG